MILFPKVTATAAATMLAISASTPLLANDLDEIVVTAKNNQSLADVLSTSYIFTLDDIEAVQAEDLTDLLDQLTGVSVRDSGGRGSATSVFIRGNTNSQIIVLIDGVRVGSATLGAAALNSYPIEAIERLEIVKGPLSGIYGADAVGGVIQMFTKKNGQGLGSVSATTGSNSLVELSAALHGGNDKNSFHLSVHSEDTDGIDRTSIITEGNEDSDGFEETAISFGGRAALGENTTANLSVLYSDNTVAFDNTFGADSGRTTDNITFSAALNLSTQFNDRLRWSSTLGINEDESITDAFASDITTNRESIGTELFVSLNDSTKLTAGVDYYQEDIETNDDFEITDRDNTGVYLLLQSTLGRVGFVGNVRYDDNSAYGSDTNSSLAINYDFTDQTRIVASYGTAFSAPSFNNLFFPNFGNPNLLPEESESYELSLLGNMSAGNTPINWRLSAYKTDVINLFSFSFDPITFAFSAANIGEAELEGVEFELNTELAAWSLGLNIDLLSATDEITGLELDDRAEQTIAATASRSFGKFDLGIAVKSESGRFDNNGTELASYGLVDLTAKYQISNQLSILANIDNIFDKDYTVNLIGESERFNTEDRQAKLTIRYNF